MDTFLMILGIILLLAGIAGCFLPVIPGPPLAFGSLILLQISERRPFTTDFLIIWAILTVIVVLVDYYIPIWGTKKFGGTKGGTWGATIGLVIGIFLFPPFGIIIGPFLGALVGEMMVGQDSTKALKSAVGSFVGFIAGTLMKLVASLIMGYYFFRAIF